MSSLSNDRSESTPFGWKYVKLSRGAAGRGTVARKGGRWRGRPRREPSEWITIRLRYTGGPEAWVVVDARGEVNPLPGYVQLVDLVLDINQAR